MSQHPSDTEAPELSAAPEADEGQDATAASEPVVTEQQVAAEEPEAPAQEPVAEQAEAPDEQAEAPLSGDSGSEQPAAQEVPVDDEAPPPGAGPKILGMAQETVIPPVKASLKDVERKERPRRRRLNATQRHRNVFFARLNEFRRQAQSSGDAQTDHEAAEAAEAAAQANTAEEPAAEAEQPQAPAVEAEQAPAPAAEAEPAPAEDTETPAAGAQPVVPSAEAADVSGEEPAPGQQRRRSTPPPQVDKARLVAAIERAGGIEVVMEALQPKRDENDQPLKWATVCADACKGLKPSDPIFSAWVRLAATPVSAIKRELGLNDPRDDRGRGRGRGGPGRGGPRRDGRGGRGGDRISREDMHHARGGSVGANIRIIGLEGTQDEKAERDARRKAEREAKRQAERDRLARLGY